MPRRRFPGSTGWGFSFLGAVESASFRGRYMSDPRDTAERLRYRLNGNLPARERMCLAILGLDKKYTDLMPRQPEGGADQGRDIECSWSDERCFVAVGFVNDARDDAKQKWEIKDKFKRDLDSAVTNANDSKEGAIRAFVFFTNVNLTTTEQEELTEIGHNAGLIHVDLYWRERIRAVLDSIEGYGIRLEYLDIVLSDAEQKAFFGRFGRDIENAIQGRFGIIEQQIEELRYFSWRRSPIHTLDLEVEFDRWYDDAQRPFDAFRVCLELQDVRGPKQSIAIGARDDYLRRPEGRAPGFGTKSFFWWGALEENPTWPKAVGSAYSGGGSRVRIVRTWRGHHALTPFAFDSLIPLLHFTSNLQQYLRAIRLTVDDYVLIDRLPNYAQAARWHRSFEWPDPLSPEEIADWRGVQVQFMVGTRHVLRRK